MDMTKFSSSQEDYLIVLSTLRRITEAIDQPGTALKKAQDQDQGQPGEPQIDRPRSLEPQGKVSNMFNGTYNTGGGNMYQGGNFNFTGESIRF